MKRKALLVFVGVIIGVVSMVGFVWFHEVGQHELQRLMDGYDSALYAKKSGTSPAWEHVNVKSESVEWSKPNVTFVQNRPTDGGKGRGNYKGRTDVFDESPVEAKASLGTPMLTPQAATTDEFVDTDAPVASYSKTSETVSEEADAGPARVQISSQNAFGQSSSLPLQSSQQQTLSGGLGGGGGLISRTVPRIRTVFEQYVDMDGQVKTRARQVTEYVQVTITPEEQAEVESFRKAVEAMKSAKEEGERTKATEELRALMHKYFQRDMQRREKDLLEAEGRVKKLREQFDKRKAAEGEIVNLRLQMMINEATGLGFSLPFDDGNPSATFSPEPSIGYAPAPLAPTWDTNSSSVAPTAVPYGQPTPDPIPQKAFPPVLDPKKSNNEPPPRNRGKSKRGTFEQQSEPSSDLAPDWNPDSRPQTAVDGEEPVHESSVSESFPTAEPLKDPSAKPETFEEKPKPDKAESPKESQGSKPDQTSELDAIEVEANIEANKALDESRREKALDAFSSEKEKELEAVKRLRTEARVSVLIKNLTSSNEARSIVAANQLGLQGKNAASAIPELQRLIDLLVDNKGFPSDKQREAFREAYVQIKEATEKEDGNTTVPEHGMEIDFPSGLTIKQKVRLLTDHLVWHGGAYSAVAAKQLASFGKDAASAIPKLEELIKIKQNEKGFPSDKQREALLEAFIKIHAAIKAEEDEKPQSLKDPGAA